MEELIRIGAYRTGADPQVDRAIALNPALEAFLSQDKDEVTSLDAGFERLDSILASVPRMILLRRRLRRTGSSGGQTHIARIDPP